ncbi:hypothetical protein APSETT444_009770 [Aspergillus pseudonomiae]
MSYAPALTTAVHNPRLRLLNALRANSKPIMTFLGLPSFRTAQIVAQTDVDLDCRYRSFRGIAARSAKDDSRGFDQKSFGCWCTVSEKSHLTIPVLKKIISGIVVPQINTAEEARAVVSHAKFPPQGLRGQGSAFPAIAHDIDIPTYMKTANEMLITCVQIESRAGVENVDAICAVPGVDMVFIGPNDLALSLLGYVPAKGNEPEFVDAIDKIIAAARKHGKWVSRLSNNGALCKEHLKVFDTVVLSYDVRAIQNWYTAELQAARS